MGFGENSVLKGCVFLGKKYLNKNTKFQCGNGNAVWFCPQSGDSKVKINGAEILLNDCSIRLIGGSRPGQCNMVPDPSTGAPGMCTSALISGTWDNDVRLKVGGKDVLCSTCSISCQVGGVIRPFKPTIVAINVDDEAKVQAVNIGQSIEENKGSNLNDTENDLNTDDANVSVIDEKSSDDRSDEEEKDEFIEEKYALCDYKNCSRANECKYLKTAHTLKETNESKNAAELKFNMGKDSFDLYAGDCGEIATTLYGNYMYSIAHHHIVPANQCFKPFAEIVKLANYYNYNINKAENGISLPTMNVGYDKQAFELRKKIAFNAMEVLGRQWHKGGHKYSCNISAEVDSILTRPFKHYKDAVDQELTSFSIQLNEEIKCRAENYAQQAADFTRTMDHICERIAKKLRKFEDNPKKAYPCFISKLAFYYAYQDELGDYEREIFGEDG